jgi:hypothetical protein
MILSQLSRVLLTTLFLSGNPASAQITFEKTYGGLSGSSAFQTPDGGYIMAGFQEFYPGPALGAIRFVKTDTAGDTLWTARWGDATTLSCVQPTADGGFIVAGSSIGNIQVGTSMAYLVKIGPNGSMLLKRWYQFTPGWPTFNHAFAVQQTPDGGYIIAGDSRYAMRLIKTNGSGDTVWTKRYGSLYDEAHSIQTTSDGGYIIAGHIYGTSYYSKAMVLLRTDASGDTLWTRTFGYGSGNSVQQTSDGGYITAGYRSVAGDHTKDSLCLVRTSATGNLLWARTYGKGRAYSVQQTTDGGYILAGGDRLVKTTSSGDTIWTRRYSGSVLSARQTSDGGYIISGGRDTSGGVSSGMYLAKTDPRGLLSAEDHQHLVQNGGFESGNEPWKFFREGSGRYSDEAAGSGSPHAAKITVATADSNLQLYQCDLRLKARTHYRLSFKGYSTSGCDLQVYLHKHDTPYTTYGLDAWYCDLTNEWRTFMCEFVSANIADSMDDGRLRFWFAPFAAAGDEYHIDEVELVETEPHPLINGDFEWDRSGWDFYTDGAGSFGAELLEGGGTNHVGHVRIDAVGSNSQLFQSHIVLDSGTKYRISFKACSQMNGRPQNPGSIGVYIHKHDAPYTSYGLEWDDLPLRSGWNSYATEFVARGFKGNVEDGRLRFWFSPSARVGEEYMIDDVTLERVDGERILRSRSDIASVESEQIDRMALLQNYPNPFNPNSDIRYQISEFRMVRLAVYDLLGREVAVLVNETKPPGAYQVRFDGSGLPSGVYFYRLEAGGFVETRKMLLVR